jgi:hypothetical protein
MSIFIYKPGRAGLNISSAAVDEIFTRASRLGSGLPGRKLLLAKNFGVHGGPRSAGGGPALCVHFSPGVKNAG